MIMDKNMREQLVCKDAGKLTPDEFYEIIMAAVEPKLPYMARGGEQPIEIMPMLDYGQRAAMASWKTLGEIPNLEYTCDVKAIAAPGGSEGIYVDVWLNTWKDDNQDIRVPLFTFKTLEENFEAYAAMGALAGAVTYTTEFFFMLNF